MQKKELLTRQGERAFLSSLFLLCSDKAAGRFLVLHCSMLKVQIFLKSRQFAYESISCFSALWFIVKINVHEADGCTLTACPYSFRHKGTDALLYLKKYSKVSFHS